MNWDGFLLQQSCKSWNNWVNHLKYFFKYTINIQRVFVISCLVHAQVLGECTQTFLLTAQILSHSIITTDLEDPFNKTTVLSHVVLIKTSDCTASKCSICSIQLKIFFSILQKFTFNNRYIYLGHNKLFQALNGHSPSEYPPHCREPWIIPIITQSAHKIIIHHLSSSALEKSKNCREL